MTSVTIGAPTGVAVERPHTVRWIISDTATMTWRYLLNVLRVPESLFFSSIQPIMFVLLFRYVFAGMIHIPQSSYVNYMIPGIFVQAVAFGSVGTAIGLAEDLQKGLIERFRALPMSRAAVLAGRTTADFVRNIFVMVLLTAVGYAVGFRAQTSLGAYLGGIGVLLLFAYALSWGFAVIGLAAPNSEAAQLMSFPILFPLTFASSAFVLVSSMPGWLQAFASHQPVTAVVNASRALMLGGPTTTYVWQALAWCIGLLLVLVPLAVWRYRRSA